jgi:hypothetical protein
VFGSCTTGWLVGLGRVHISCSEGRGGEGRGGDLVWHELRTQFHENQSDGECMLILFTDCPTSPLHRSATELMVSRAVSGFGVGIMFTVCPMYVAEIADNSVRGILGTTLSCD